MVAEISTGSLQRIPEIVDEKVVGFVVGLYTVCRPRAQVCDVCVTSGMAVMRLAVGDPAGEGIWVCSSARRPAIGCKRRLGGDKKQSDICSRQEVFV